MLTGSLGRRQCTISGYIHKLSRWWSAALCSSTPALTSSQAAAHLLALDTPSHASGHVTAATVCTSPAVRHPNLAQLLLAYRRQLTLCVFQPITQPLQSSAYVSQTSQNSVGCAMLCCSFSSKGITASRQLLPQQLHQQMHLQQALHSRKRARTAAADLLLAQCVRVAPLTLSVSCSPHSWRPTSC